MKISQRRCFFTSVLLGLGLLSFGIIPVLSNAQEYPVAQELSAPEDNHGLPIFRFNDDQWFELTIPNQGRPETAIEIQEEINRQQLEENAEKEGRNQVFPNELDFLNGIQIRYQLRFK